MGYPCLWASSGGPRCGRDPDEPREGAYSEQLGTSHSSAIERSVPCDSYPMAIAALRIIVPEREMLRTSIVPECYRIRSPLKSTVKFGGFDVPEERLQDRIAFAFVQLNDPRSEHSIDE